MGLFKSIGKAIKKVAKVAKVVAKVPIVSTVARTVVGSVPVLGGVVSAVGRVKAAIHPPTLANTAKLSARTGVPAFGHPGIMQTTRTPHGSRARTTTGAHGRFGRWVAKAKRQDAYKREHVRHRRAGGSAKQRAARARFAAAAKRGRIKKGTRL